MNYLISALIITFAIPVWGLLIHFVEKVIYKLMVRITTPKIAYFTVNWLTFPGVMHHELSHAIFAFITGARITEFKLFCPNKATGELGHVSFAPRGPFFIKALQMSLASTAPVIMGTISSMFIIIYLSSNTDILPVYMMVLFIYLLVSIIFHASMSYADVKVMFKGIWVIAIIAYVACLFWKIDFFNGFLVL
ncbi:MAG: hypothetical protein K6A23_09160 [Butyrivibrio sp.]|nr:hypothetical protein [Butyrivibrio sp.]